jgi:hypothetical protein
LKTAIVMLNWFRHPSPFRPLGAFAGWTLTHVQGDDGVFVCLILRPTAAIAR